MTNTNKAVSTRFNRLSNELVRAGLSSHSVPVHMLRLVSDRLLAYVPKQEITADVAARLARRFAEISPMPAWSAVESFLYWLLLAESPRLDSVIDEARDIIAACES